MISLKAIASFISVLLFAGCTMTPTPEEFRSAEYGPKIEKAEFEEKVRNEAGFVDPYSAVIKCSEPKKGGGKAGLKKRFGWIAECNYNAKNRVGGYTGEKEQDFMVSKGELFPLYIKWDYRYSY